MTVLSQFKMTGRAEVRLLLVLPAFYALLCLTQLNDYLRLTSVNFIIGCIALPFVLPSTGTGKASARYGVASLLFCAAYFLLPVKTCLYMAMICALLFLFESTQGRTSALPLFTLMLMSPVAQSFADTFSFPLRLRLTSVAGHLMQAAGNRVEVTGNVIASNGNEFAVDPACMGLHMLLSALLCCLLIVGVLQKKTGRSLNTIKIIAACISVLLLSILSNLIRILLLVQFRVMPATAMHEITGIFCLLLYVILPTLVAMRWLMRKNAAAATSSAQPTLPPRMNYGLHILLATLMIAGCISAADKAKHPVFAALPQVPGYACSHYDSNVVKLENIAALVYLKDLRGYSFTEHNPMLCWTGGGYAFRQVQETSIAGVPVIAGILQRGQDTLHTAWWYTNGLANTISTFDWRWDALRHGASYYIVNVTASDATHLREEVKKISTNASLRSWINPSLKLSL